jgi:hypothetical protein
VVFDSVGIRLGLPSDVIVEPLPTAAAIDDVLIASGAGSGDRPFFEFVSFPAGHVFTDESDAFVPPSSAEVPFNTPRALGVGLTSALEHERSGPFGVESSVDSVIGGFPALLVVTPPSGIVTAMAHKLYLQLPDGRIFLVSMPGLMCDMSREDQRRLFDSVVDSIRPTT